MEVKHNIKNELWLPVEIEQSCTKSTTKRIIRASDNQKHELIKYFEDRPGAILVCENSARDPRAKQRIWIELAHKLNGVDGALKPSARWAKYWHDMVLNAKMKAKRAISGESFPNQPNKFDERLLRVVKEFDLLQKWMNITPTHEAPPDIEWSETVSSFMCGLSDFKLIFLSTDRCSFARNGFIDGRWHKC